jgi:CBS domain-containing membrane protein
MNLKALFASFRPTFDPVSLTEKFRSSVAAMFSMLLLGEILHLLPDGGQPMILFASMAAANVLMYAAPHSPMAQPWPLVVGNLLSGAVGLMCVVFIPDPVIAAACAVGLSILVMHLAHALHPPGASTAMIIVLNAAHIQQSGWIWAAEAVLTNAVFSLLLAFVINNLIHVGRYPMQRHQLQPPSIAAHSDNLAIENIEWALGKMDGVIDVSEEDLLEIYRLAAEHARNNSSAFLKS